MFGKRLIAVGLSIAAALPFGFSLDDTDACPTTFFPGIDLPTTFGLNTCIPAVAQQFDVLVKDTPQCLESDISAWTDILTTVISDDVFAKVVTMIPHLSGDLDVSTVMKVLPIIAGIESSEMNGMCSMISSKISPCLGALVGGLLKFAQENKCCSGLQTIIKVAEIAVVPADFNGGLESLLSTIMYDIESIVCSKISIGEASEEASTCGYTLLNGLIPSADVGVVLSNIMAVLPNMFNIPRDEQCKALKGEEFKTADGSTANIFKFERCSVPWDNLMRLIQKVPASGLLGSMSIPVLEIKLSEVFTGYSEAPCCAFDSDFTLATDYFNSVEIPLNCGGSNADNSGCETGSEDCSACKESDLGMLNIIPGANTCINTPSGISIATVLEDFGNAESCDISMVTDLLALKGFEDLLDAISEGEVTKVLSAMAKLENESFNDLCQVVNEKVMKCLSNVVPKVFKRLENECCQDFSKVLNIASLVIVPEGVSGGLEGFLTTLLYDAQNAVCSTRKESDVEDETCIFNLIKDSHLLTSITNIFSLPAEPKNLQCDAFSGKSVKVDGKTVKLWDFGQCSAYLTVLLRRIGSIPILRLAGELSIGELLSVFGIDSTAGAAVGSLLPKIGVILEGAVNTPCCEFSTTAEIPKTYFKLTVPTFDCAKGEECRASTVLSSLDLSSLPNSKDLDQCYGSGWNAHKVFDLFGSSDKCKDLVIEDIVGFKHPSLKSIVPIAKKAIEMIQEDETKGLLLTVEYLFEVVQSDFTNDGMGTFCEFLDTNLGGCLSDWIGGIFESLSTNQCCDNFAKYVNEDLYPNEIRPNGLDGVYPDAASFLKGILNNFNAVLCSKSEKHDNAYCGYSLLSNTLGVDYKKSSRADPLTALAVFGLYPLFQMVNVPQGQACNMLRKIPFVTNTESCNVWKGMWFDYGCCGTSFSSLLSTIGGIKALEKYINDVTIDLKTLGLGNFLENEVKLSNLLSGYEDLGCCAHPSSGDLYLGKCSYASKEDSVYKVDLPPITEDCKIFQSTCSLS